VVKKKTGLVGPVPRGVELRCGHITTRRELATKFSGRFDRKRHCDPRASLKSSETGRTCAWA